jgi:hypothetical protein
VTKRVVRFLERTQGVRITEIGLDYAVDDALKIWLLWSTKVREDLCLACLSCI